MSLVGVSLLTAASISFAGAQNNASGNRAASAPTVVTNLGKGTLKFGGTVDLRTLPTIKAGSQTDTRSLKAKDRMTPAERAAYQASLTTNSRVSRAAGQGMSAPKSANTIPSFADGGASPLLVRSVDGLNDLQACNCIPPDQAIATDLSYVMA
jgi:hypothetical protein